MKKIFLLLFLGITCQLKAQEKPNVLFFAFDDLRPLIGAYGEPEPITPNIDALAAESTRFNNAYVTYPLCSPSRAAMLTGVRFDNKVWVNGKKTWTFPKMIGIQDTWPRVVRANGYWTATRGKFTMATSLITIKPLGIFLDPKVLKGLQMVVPK